MENREVLEQVRGLHKWEREDTLGAMVEAFPEDFKKSSLIDQSVFEDMQHATYRIQSVDPIIERICQKLSVLIEELRATTAVAPGIIESVVDMEVELSFAHEDIVLTGKDIVKIGRKLR